MALVGYSWRQVKLEAQAPGKQVLSSTTEAAAATVPDARQYLWARGIMGGMQEWGGFVNLVGVSLHKNRTAWASSRLASGVASPAARLERRSTI